MNNERLVPLDDQTLAVIEGPQRAGRLERALLLETARGHKTRHVHLKAALDEATVGIEIADGMTTHRLRHTTASLLIMAGANPAAVRKIMRHSDPKMTRPLHAPRARVPARRG